MSDRLVVNLDEFAELCGVTPETMRGYVKAVEGEPDWLIKRGTRGRGYEIDARGGLTWWRKLRDDEAAATADRAAQLGQLRLELTGGIIETQEALALSGKQRIQEYQAAEAAAKYRKTMGDLIDRNDLVEALASVIVDLRHRLMQVPGEFAVREGLNPHLAIPLEEMIGRAIDDFVRGIAKEAPAEIGNVVAGAVAVA